MSQTPPEVIRVVFIFTAFWLVTVLVIILAGRYFVAVGRFREQMLSQWKPALVISAIFVISLGVGGSGFLNPYAIAIFCQAMIGLAIASDISNFDALPVTHAIRQRQKIVREVTLLLCISILVVVPALLIGTVGLNVGRQIFGETYNAQQAASTIFPGNKWLVFFSLLGGAGIAEETTYRLVVLPLIWKLTQRSWLAIIISALIFGAYHLTPLNSFYLTFRQFPISQFTASALISLVWGYLFVKRGYETVVLGHALSDWLPLMLFIH